MDDKFDFKPVLPNLLNQEKISELIKNNPEFFKTDLTPRFTTETPKFEYIKQQPIVVKEEKPPKKGIEAWYERNVGKVVFALALLNFLQGIIIVILSQ